MKKKIISALLGRSLIAFSGLGVTYYLPQNLSLDEVGLVYLTITQVTLLSVLFRGGLDYSIIPSLISINVEKEAINLLIKAVVTIIFLSILFIATYILVIDIFNPLQFSHTNTLWLFSVWIWSFSLSICLLIFQFFRIQGKIFRATIARGLLINLSILLILTYKSIGNFNTGFYTLIFLFSIQMLMLSVVICWSEIKKINLNKLGFFDFNLISKKFFLYSILSVLSTDIDYWIIIYFLNNSDIALYSSAKRLSILSAIFIDLANLTLPNLYKESDINFYVKISKAIALGFSIISIFLLVIFSIYSELIISTFFNSYNDTQVKITSNILIILLISSTLSIMLGFSEIFLILNNDKNALILGNIMSIVTFLILSLILIPYFKLYGVSISFLLSNLILRIYLNLYTTKKYKINLLLGIKR